MQAEKMKMDSVKAAFNADKKALLEKIELLEQQLRQKK